MNLALVTVNYNCAPRTLGLLRSLAAQTDRDFATIVVDNDSAPRDREVLGRAASEPLALDIIHADHNGGFAAGCNVGLRRAFGQGADWVLLINPDTTVAPDFIAQLRATLSDGPALIGLPLQEGGQLVRGGRVRWLHTTLAHTTTPDGGAYVVGAGMVIHREVYQRIGGLDERYFLYFEDVAYTCRARRMGVPVRFLDRPTITHAVSQSTSSLGAPALLRYHMRNALLFNHDAGPWWVRMALPGWAFFATIKQFVKYLVRPSHRAPARAILAGVRDYYDNRFGTTAQSEAHRHRV